MRTVYGCVLSSARVWLGSSSTVNSTMNLPTERRLEQFGGFIAFAMLFAGIRSCIRRLVCLLSCSLALAFLLESFSRQANVLSSFRHMHTLYLDTAPLPAGSVKVQLHLCDRASGDKLDQKFNKHTHTTSLDCQHEVRGLSKMVPSDFRHF